MAQDNNRYYNNYDPSSVLPGDLAYEIDEVNTSECDNLKENKGTSGNDNNNCDVLSNELIEAIRQVYYSIKNGDIVISANEDSKCDGSQLPTVASILSRLLRFDEAVACILCTYDPILIKILKSGEYPQVLMGQTGSVYPVWKNVSETPTEGSMLPITSGGVYDAIKEAQLSVFHKITDDPNWVKAGGLYEYDYFASSDEDLDAQSLGYDFKMYADLNLDSTPSTRSSGMLSFYRATTSDDAEDWRILATHNAIALKKQGSSDTGLNANELSEVFDSLTFNNIATGTDVFTVCPNWADNFKSKFFPTNPFSPYYGKMIYAYEDVTGCGDFPNQHGNVNGWNISLEAPGVTPTSNRHPSNFIPRLWGIALLREYNSGKFAFLKYTIDNFAYVYDQSQYFSLKSNLSDMTYRTDNQDMFAGEIDLTFPEDNDVALVNYCERRSGRESCYFKQMVYDASAKEWVLGKYLNTAPSNYSVIRVDKGTYADKELYSLGNKFNLLDGSIADVNDRINKLEALCDRAVLSADFDYNGDKYALLVRDTYDEAVSAPTVPNCTTIALVIGAP